jgi:O-antigen/teichoic acid export membrane protein
LRHFGRPEDVLESPIQKFGRDVIIIGIFNVLSALSSLLLLPVLTKALGAHDYGIMSQVNVTKGLFVVVASMGLPAAFARFLAGEKNRDEIRRQFYSIFSLVAAASLVLSAVLFIFAGFIARTFFEGSVQIVRITSLICLVWVLDGMCMNFFKTFQQMKRFAIMGIMVTYTEIGVIIFLVLNGHPLTSVVLAYFIIEALWLIVLLYSVSSQIGFRLPRFSNMGKYFSLALPMIPADVSLWILNFSDVYVVGYFLGPASVGIYSASYGLGYVLYPLSAILSFVLLPALSRLHDENRIEEVKVLLSYSVKYYLALAIPFIFGASVLAEPVLRLLSNQEIATGGRFVTPIVVLGIGFYGIGTMVRQILIVRRKTGVFGVMWGVLALMNLGGNIVLVPHIGIIAAALTTLGAFFIAFVVIMRYSLNEMRFHIDTGFIFKSLLAAVVMSVVAWVLKGHLKVMIVVVIGVVVYFAILVLLRGFKKEEWRYALNLIKKPI